MNFVLFIAAALAWAPQSPLPSREQPAAPSVVKPASAEAFAAEMELYGEWLRRVHAIQATAQAHLSGLQRLQGTLSGPGARGGFAAAGQQIAQAVAALDEAHQQLLSVDTPSFPALQLDADLQPAEMRNHLVRLNRELRGGAQHLGELSQAATRNDATAGLRAAQRMMNSFRTVFDTQIVMTRAGLAAVPREASQWEMINVELIYFRTAARMMNLDPMQAPRPDPTLARDLTGFADRLDELAEQGTIKLEREIETWTGTLRQLEDRKDRPAVEVARRTLAMLEAEREVFPLGRQLSAALRAQAQSIGARPVTPEILTRVFNALRPVREGLDRVAFAESNGMAGVPN